MNFIWNPFIEAIKAGYDMTKINYRLDRPRTDGFDGNDVFTPADAHQVSPYLEYTPVALLDPDSIISKEEKFSRVDVNPYIRFGKIFSHILDPERSEPNDLAICNIITHMLAHVDRICGMDKRNFRVRLIAREIEGGCYGKCTEAFQLFSASEKRALAEALIRLYETSDVLKCLDALFHTIMTDFRVHVLGDFEVVFYNPYPYDEQEDEKLQFIIQIFLPMDFEHVVHWQYTYGTVEHDVSMMLEGFVL